MDGTDRNVPYGYCRCGCGGKTTISPQSHTKKGYVKGEPRAYISGHNGETRKRPLMERVWEKVDVGAPNDCWPFTGYLNPEGYGQVHVGNGRCRLVHRLTAEEAHGPCPPGLEARHLCGTRACCNPAHLRWGTREENTRDRMLHAQGKRVLDA